jgi:uncharacterized protein YebE (UPF0316 family)
MEIDGKLLPEARSLIMSLDPRAFIVVHETKKVYNGFMKRK